MKGLSYHWSFPVYLYDSNETIIFVPSCLSNMMLGLTTQARTQQVQKLIQLQAKLNLSSLEAVRVGKIFFHGNQKNKKQKPDWIICYILQINMHFWSIEDKTTCQYLCNRMSYSKSSTSHYCFNFMKNEIKHDRVHLILRFVLIGYKYPKKSSI